MTHLRKMMLEELERRNYSKGTIRNYLRFVERFAKHFGKSPDKLGPEHLRNYQAYLFKGRKLCARSVEHHVAALRLFFVRVLHRHEFRQFLPYPKVRRKLPNILSREEVARLIEASSSLFQRTLPMVLYGTGMRRAQVARLKIADIDSRRTISTWSTARAIRTAICPMSALKPAMESMNCNVNRAVSRCRTAALGGHKDKCVDCQYEAPISYNSCRSPCCPKCQAQARRRWLQAQQRDLLNTNYFHLVFTIPHDLIL